MKLAKVSALLFVCLTISACSWFASPERREQRNWEEPPEQTTELDDEAFSRALGEGSLEDQDLATTSEQDPQVVEEQRVPGIELTWEAPGKPFDGFVIHYGFEKSDLSKRLKIPTESISLVGGPDDQSRFRYVIGGIPPEKTVYIAVSSFKGSEESPLSEVWEVQPAKIDKM